MRKIIARSCLNELPRNPLPFYVRSAGYNEAEYGWQEYFPAGEKPFVQLFWTIQGAGEFRLGGKSLTLRSGETFVHLPGEEHRHRSCDSGSVWKYCWFTFDGPLAETFYRAYGYPRAVMNSGICPVNLFCELETLVREKSLYASRHAVAVAAEILAQAGGKTDRPQMRTIPQQFTALAEESIADPAVTVEKLAAKLGVHRTTLRYLFKRETGYTPGAYLDRLRLSHALELLKHTRLSIKECAAQCGCRRPGYFAAVIRKATGSSPEKFRMQQKILQTEDYLRPEK